MAAGARLLSGAAVPLAMLALTAPTANAAPTWLPSAAVSAPAATVAGPDLAVDAGGGLTAAWQESSAGTTVIQSASRPAGGGWGTPVDLSVPDRNSRRPQIAADAGGAAVAAWESYNGVGYVVESSFRPAGGGWQAAAQISSAAQSAEAPQVAIDGAGDVLAVWQAYDGARYLIQAAYRPAGGAWQPPQGLSPAGETAKAPAIAMDDRGDAIAVWERPEGGGVVESSFRPAGGGWQAAAQISSAAQSAEAPQVAIDGAGDVLAVWQAYDGARYLIQAAYRPAGGAWQPPQGLSPAGETAKAPAIAMDDRGDASVVWDSFDGANYLVESSTRPAGGGWSAAGPLSPAGGGSESPTVAVGSRGAVAVWQRANGVNTVVEAATRPDGASWGPAHEISTIGGESLEPQAVVDGEGNAAAAWARFTSSTGVVEAAGYDAAGPQIRGLAVQAAGTVQEPLSFSLSAFDVWSPLGPTIWAFGDGGSAEGPAVSHAYAHPGVYRVGVTALDAVGNSSDATATVSVFPKPNASRTVWVVGREALLRLRCPSPAGCHGALKLVRGVSASPGGRAGRAAGRRVRIGGANFQIRGQAESVVRIGLIGEMVRQLREARSGMEKAQLTGPGVRHRAVVLTERRARVARVARRRGRRVTLSLRCRRGLPCRGHLELALSPNRHAAPPTRLGSGRFRLAAGATGHVVVRIAPRAAALLSRLSGGTARAVVSGSGIQPRMVVVAG